VQIVIIFEEFFSIDKNCNLLSFKNKRTNYFIFYIYFIYIFGQHHFNLLYRTWNLIPDLQQATVQHGWDSIRAVTARNRTARVEEWCASWPWTIRKAGEINRAIKADGRALTC